MKKQETICWAADKNFKPIRILAIETSCDETAISLVEASGSVGALFLGLPDGLQFKVIADVLSSQIDVHREFGGVVPNLAKREHIKNLPVLLERIVGNGGANKKAINYELRADNFFEKVDLIAVTVGPGLEPALWAGITFAKELAKKYKKKLIGVNHLEGHLYSFLIQKIARAKSQEPNSRQLKNSKLKIQNLGEVFPAIGLVISGGHTVLVKMDSLLKYKKIGETVDDAAGEAYDKVARLLGLPYPGGPEIEKISLDGNVEAINFPRPMLGQKNYNFSFSGLKTSVLYYLRDNPLPKNDLAALRLRQANIAASFQKAVFDVLIKKTIRAVDEFGAKSVFISGGVAASKSLRQEFKKNLKIHFKEKTSGSDTGVVGKINFFPTDIATDNSLMIAAAGYLNFLTGKKYKIKADGNINL